MGEEAERRGTDREELSMSMLVNMCSFFVISTVCEIYLIELAMVKETVEN